MSGPMKHHSTKRDYWRSLEHLANTSSVQGLADNEFGSYDPDEMLKLPEASRRRFLQLASASMALAGLTLSGCRRWPEEHLVPYAARPQGHMPGVQDRYATAMELGGVAQPLLVSSFDFRPIKIEGNPTHPYSNGAATAMAQGSLLDLYDPNRSRGVVQANGDKREPSTFNAFAGALASTLAAAGQPGGGQGDTIAILSESTSSPTTARLRAEVQRKLPQLSWYEYEPLSRDNALAGARLATGKAVRCIPQLDKAAIVVSFDDDFVGNHPAQIKLAGDWAKRRKTVDAGQMSRVYHFETAFTLTGTVADVRVPCKTAHVLTGMLYLAGKLGVSAPVSSGALAEGQQKALDRAVADIQANRGSSLILAGCHLPPEAHQLALAINDAIGAIGADKPLMLVQDPAGDRPTHFEAITELKRQILAGKFKTLLILGGNPAYNAPADLDFVSVFNTEGLQTIHLSCYNDETSQLCKWHINRAHYLEAWSDSRTFDGTPVICQPLIQPLFDGKTVDEVLEVFLMDPNATTRPTTSSEQVVRSTFAHMMGENYTDLAFRKALNDGLVEGQAYAPFAGAIKGPGSLPMPSADGFELRFNSSFGLYDGRFAPNGWLQELPDTMTKIVWDNAALISKKDADDAGITTGDLVTITLANKTMNIAAYVMPGQPRGVIGLALGYGRTEAGPVGNGVGFNAFAIRTLVSPFVAAGASIAKAGGTYLLALTQNHYLLDSIGFKGAEERTGDKGTSAELIRQATLTEYKADAAHFKRKEDGSLPLQLWDPPNKFNDPSAWGMAVDMNSCIGCGACVVACQAENNIPIVGKDQAANNRAMHWIRIDRYFRGDAADPANDPNPEVVHQPVMCQHCENAPCEQVCPVGATMHDTEGLNVMTYNRCIGTRYCSNNCPYKVRRFNYLDWHSQDPRHDAFPMPYPNLPDMQQREQVDVIKRMVFNPEVTVRMRGVMEKCTYCVQRIHNTQISKRANGEEMKDGDILTACQQTCPTQAIVFGDLNLKDSKVTQMQKGPRTYSLLADLDTRPRTQYLGKVRNPDGGA